MVISPNSTKPVPYVYVGIHNTTGEFYIGYREVNDLPSSTDLGSMYKTSSNKVHERGFDNFSWMIVAEFLDGSAAYDYEQDIIREWWGHPLLLNGSVRRTNGGMRFRSTDEEIRKKMRKPKSEEGRKNIGEAARNRDHSYMETDSYKEKQSISKKDKPQPKWVVDKRMAAIIESNKNNPERLAARIAKMKATKLANPKPAWNKGKKWDEATKIKMRKPKGKRKTKEIQSLPPL